MYCIERESGVGLGCRKTKARSAAAITKGNITMNKIDVIERIIHDATSREHMRAAGCPQGQLGQGCQNCPENEDCEIWNSFDRDHELMPDPATNQVAAVVWARTFLRMAPII